MRKSLAFISGALLIGAASCSQEEVVSPVAGGGNVNFQVSLPAGGYGTRAFSDGLTAENLKVAVYDADGDKLVTTKDAVFNNSLQTTVSLNLANGKAYKIVFFASKESQSVYDFDTETATLSVDYSQMTAYNSEDYDCFYVMETIEVVTGPITKTVTLTRPLAQVNWGTADLGVETISGGNNPAYGANAENLKSSATFSGATVYTKMNMLDGEVSEPVANNTLTFTALERPSANESFPVEGYEYLSMAYLLVAEDNALVDAKLTITGGGEPIEVKVPSMPIQRNYRTNVYGNLLTNPADYTVKKDNDFKEPGNPVEFDSEGFRITTSLQEALDLAAKGQDVAVDGDMLDDTQTRSLPTVIFRLNKSVRHQRIKINGEAKGNVKVMYGELGEGETEAESHKFTLVVTTAAKGVEVDLEDAEVAIEGKVDEEGNKATVEELTITNAGSAGIGGSVAVEDLKVADDADCDVNFDGDVTLGVSTADDLIAALGTDAVTEINVNADIDLTNTTLEQLQVKGAKVMTLADDVTITLGCQVYFESYDDFTVQGNGTITNEQKNTPERQPQGLQLFLVRSGTFTAENVTMINDQNYHYHGSTFNSTCIGYYPKANVTLKGVTAYSGEFTICGYNRTVSGAESIVNLTDCHLESNSSTAHGTGNYSYCARINGKKSVVTNCTIVGIQGALAPDYVSEMTINGGDYYTHYLDEEKKTGNCYGALYVTGGSIVTILDGKFYSPNTETCVRAGDNDVNFPTGQIIVKGGRYNHKPWNHVTKEVYEPVEGYIYEENTGGDKDRYPWVVVKD